MCTSFSGFGMVFRQAKCCYQKDVSPGLPTQSIFFKLNLVYKVWVRGVARIFHWGGGQTTNHMQWRHQKLSKEELVLSKGIVKWKTRSRGLILTRNQDFAKREGLNPKLNSKKSKAEDASSKLVELKCNPDGGLRAEAMASGGEVPSRWMVFYNFLGKGYFNAVGSLFARFQRLLKELNF